MTTVTQTDPLTGLANRGTWEARLTNLVASRAFPLSVVVVELGSVTLADPAADRRRIEAAAAFRANLRSTDLLARTGPAQFAVILPGCGSGEAAYVAERLRGVVPPGQTATVGPVSWDGSEDVESLLARAGDAVRASAPERRRRVVAVA